MPSRDRNNTRRYSGTRNPNTPTRNTKKRDSAARNPDKRSASEATAKTTTKTTTTHRSARHVSSQRGKASAEARIRTRIIALVIAACIVVSLGVYFLVDVIMERQIGFINPQDTNINDNYATQQPMSRRDDVGAEGEIIEPDPQKVRDVSYGAIDIEFEERQINRPGLFDKDLVFSAGTGSLDGEVLTKLYIYNLETGTEELVAKSEVGYYGEIYETYVNNSWIVWIDTDKGTKNNINVMNRETKNISTLRTSENGQPKLRLYGDTLVWMEQVSDSVDKLYMVDLNVQEDLTLSDFTDKATYGVSAPCVYGNTIVWAGPSEDGSADKSGIYYLRLEADEQGMFNEPDKFFPGTYVHEPLYNGDVFVWLDTNKSRDGKLYMGRPGEEPKVIDQNITTYSLGDDIVVYGKNTSIWAYVISTGELCRLTSPGEMGMLPVVSKRTVVWYNLSADSEKDVLRYKILTDDELYPGGK